MDVSDITVLCAIICPYFLFPHLAHKKGCFITNIISVLQSGQITGSLCRTTSNIKHALILCLIESLFFISNLFLIYNFVFQIGTFHIAGR